MKARSLVSTVLASATILAMASASRAQDANVLLFEDFETGLDGWEISGDDASVGWGADAIPSGAAPVTQPYWSPANSLNYNGPVGTYDTGFANSGMARAPGVNISSAPAPVLKFRCNHHTDTTDAQAWTDMRVLMITPDVPDGGFGAAIVWYSQTLGVTNADPSIGACAPAGTWHTHTVALDPAWGAIAIKFNFNTIDNVNNANQGWFVDNVRVLADGEGSDVDPGPPPPPGGGNGGGSGGSGGGGDDDDDSRSFCGGTANTGAAGALPLAVCAVVLAVMVLRAR